MRRGRLLILFALIILFGVLALYLLLGRGRGAQPPAAAGTPAAPLDTTYIVIAVQDIARGSLIPADAVGLTPWRTDQVVETMIENDVNQVIGRYARQDIERGFPITTNMITRAAGDILGTGSDAAIAIPAGYTAIAIPMNRLSGVAYALRDGDKVDVIITMLMVDLDPDFQTVLPNDTLLLIGPDGTILTGMGCTEMRQSDMGPECVNPEPPPFGRVDSESETEQSLYIVPIESQRPRLVTQRLIENATVLHVGSFAFPGEAEAAAALQAQQQAQAQQAGQPAPAQEGPRPPDIITLIVRPQDALALNWAVRAGAQLTLTLRAPGDLTPTDTVSVSLEYLMRNYNISVPSRLPYGLEPRRDEIIEPVLPNDAVSASP
ncbi:MAG: Flp pilus assembly protein CpaB [Chloroflexota bacterium]